MIFEFIWLYVVELIGVLLWKKFVQCELMWVFCCWIVFCLFGVEFYFFVRRGCSFFYCGVVSGLMVLFSRFQYVLVLYGSICLMQFYQKQLLIKCGLVVIVVVFMGQYDLIRFCCMEVGVEMLDVLILLKFIFVIGKMFLSNLKLFVYDGFNFGQFWYGQQLNSVQLVFWSIWDGRKLVVQVCYEFIDSLQQLVFLLLLLQYIVIDIRLFVFFMMLQVLLII